MSPKQLEKINTLLFLGGALYFFWTRSTSIQLVGEERAIVARALEREYSTTRDPRIVDIAARLQ